MNDVTREGRSEVDEERAQQVRDPIERALMETGNNWGEATRRARDTLFENVFGRTAEVADSLADGLFQFATNQEGQPDARTTRVYEHRIFSIPTDSGSLRLRMSFDEDRLFIRSAEFVTLRGERHPINDIRTSSGARETVTVLRPDALRDPAINESPL